MLDWIQTYQYVKITGIHCPQSKVEKLVPQRSFQELRLFIFYTFDINKCLDLILVHYVDENTALDNGTTLEILSSRINCGI